MVVGGWGEGWECMGNDYFCISTYLLYYLIGYNYIIPLSSDKYQIKNCLRIKTIYV